MFRMHWFRCQPFFRATRPFPPYLTAAHVCFCSECINSVRMKSHYRYKAYAGVFWCGHWSVCSSNVLSIHEKSAPCVWRGCKNHREKRDDDSTSRSIIRTIMYIYTRPCLCTSCLLVIFYFYDMIYIYSILYWFLHEMWRRNSSIYDGVIGRHVLLSPSPPLICASPHTVITADPHQTLHPVHRHPVGHT